MKIRSSYEVEKVKGGTTMRSKKSCRVLILKLMMMAGVLMMIFGCGNDSNPASNQTSEEVASNSLYVPENYEQILKENDLTEIVAMPYFKSPFFTIANNKNNEQVAVMIRDTGEVKIIKLTKTLEEIVEILEAKGFSIPTSGNHFENLQLLEINKQLLWSYMEANVYLDLEGNEIDPFKK